MNAYDSFLYTKAHVGANHGFTPTFMPSKLFDFQQAMIEYAVSKGRAALFEDCGMGKTAQFLTWAQNVVEHTNKRVLILTPLAASGPRNGPLPPKRDCSCIPPAKCICR